MVDLALTNINPHSRHHGVTINLATRLCTFDDKQEIELKSLLNESDFSHPLLTEQFIPASDNVFHYEYEDVDGLLYAAIYVYSTLIHVENPVACKFKINPSPAFQRAKVEKDIYFSVNSKETAKELIRITQLEAFIGEMGGFTFEFSEDTIINDEFTITDLPDFIKGDELYYADPEVVTLLKTPVDTRRYELRYLNGDIGLGVFTRVAIPEGDIIGVYTGVKSIDIPPPRNYAYVKRLDALNMMLDARPHGNIARFINHAPDLNEETVVSSETPFLDSNIKVVFHYLNGIKIVVYVAKREILPGEPLLVDYGERFFKGKTVRRFDIHGQVVDVRNQFYHPMKEKELRHKMIMATHGVNQAQTFMLGRLFKVILVIVILMSGLNYVL